MNAPIIDITGKKQGTFKLPEEFFAAKINQTVLAQYLRIYSHRTRQNTVSSKSRSEIIGTTAKVWRQKGTGRARHGSRKAPIFVGGGKAHGPSGTQNYKKTAPKKIRRQALFAALSTKSNNVIVTTGWQKLNKKTKSLKNAIEKICKDKANNSTTIILDAPNTQVVKSASNLKNIHITQAHRINAYEILNTHNLLFTKESLNKLQQTFLKNVSNQSNTPPKK